MTILSVPRDLYVAIPGMGHNRINAAFNTGPALLVQTVPSALGIPVNHYVEVNFDSFRQITAAVGGVKFYFPTPAKDHFSNLDVSNPGCISLTGDQALGFVRSRHYEYYQNGRWHFEAESDLARIQRQQAFIKKMIKKAQGSVTNPIALNGIVSGVTSNLTVDSGFSKSLMLSLAKDFRSVNAGTISTTTIPNFPETIGGGSVLGLQQPQASQAIAAFNALGTAPAAANSTSSTPAPTTAPPAKAVPPSSVSIEVANGSGVTGQAGQATADLQKLGYKATTNASLQGSGFATSEIKYAPDALGAAQQLQSQLGGAATLVSTAALSSSPYQL
ncbi:MAG: LCP family protein, partial [Acidimicrobiales bacterium]